MLIWKEFKNLSLEAKTKYQGKDVSIRISRQNYTLTTDLVVLKMLTLENGWVEVFQTPVPVICISQEEWDEGLGLVKEYAENLFGSEALV